MIRECLVKLSQKQSLSESETHDTMLEILEGKATQAQIASYLSFLTFKSETAEEVVGSVKAMREKMTPLNAEGLNAIDVCGTGGDHKGTFNISTVAALVLAGGGIVVAKHGNRAASSQCGSAEVLEALGVKLDPPIRTLEHCLQEAKIAFLFAPHFHPAMKNVGPLRKEIGFRTMFNILGPMCNPASVKRQVVGVFNQEKAELVAEVLRRSGTEKVITLHSEDGLDEVSCATQTTLNERYPEQKPEQKIFNKYQISPEDFGFQRSSLNEILGGDAKTNAKIVMEVLEGEKGPRRDAVVMNAAIGFYLVSDRSKLEKQYLKEYRALAEESIDSGKALKALKSLEAVSHQ